MENKIWFGGKLNFVWGNAIPMREREGARVFSFRTSQFPCMRELGDIFLFPRRQQIVDYDASGDTRLGAFDARGRRRRRSRGKVKKKKKKKEEKEK